jgi:hypothetical protein
MEKKVQIKDRVVIVLNIPYFQLTFVLLIFTYIQVYIYI